MQNNPNNTEIFNVVRSYRRYTKLISTIIVSLIVIIAPIVLAPKLTGVDLASLRMVTIPLGVLLLVVAIVTFIRQGRGLKSATNQTSQKATYVDTTGDAIEYMAPQDASSDSNSSGLLANQHCVVLLAPAMASGVVATGGLGQTSVQHQENAVILTENAILAVQIPLATGTIGGATQVGDVLSLLGVDTTEQNLFSSAIGGGQLKKAIQDTVATMSLSDIASKYYSYVLPLSTVVSVKEAMLGNIVVTTNTGKHMWACTDQAARAQFIQELQRRIAPVQVVPQPAQV